MKQLTCSPHNRATAERSNHSADSSANERITTILLVDAHAWTREAFARGIEMAARDLRVVRFADIAELPDAVPPAGTAVVLLNVDGNKLSDPHVSLAITGARSRLPGVPVVALSEGDDADSILEAIEHGLSGYVPMSLELRLVVHALQFVAAGGTFVPAEPLLTSLETLVDNGLQVTLPDTRPTPAVIMNQFTPRELGVLHLVRQGKSNKQIARELNTREATVKVHVRNIMRKLGTANRTQAALLADALLT